MTFSPATDPIPDDAPPAEPTKAPVEAPASTPTKPEVSRPKPKQPLLPYPWEHGPASNL